MVLGLAANERMAREDRDGFIDQVQRFQLCFRSFVSKKIADPFQIGKRTASVTYSRHGFLAGLLV